jgi:hypothetical protein
MGTVVLNKVPVTAAPDIDIHAVCQGNQHTAWTCTTLQRQLCCTVSQIRTCDLNNTPLQLPRKH